MKISENDSHEKQKSLNQAFYGTVGMSVITILFVIFLNKSFGLSTFGYIEIIIFPILGYLVKKGSFPASKFLLLAFVIDRIAAVFNQLFNISPVNIITFVAWTLFFWQLYYKAYLYLKIEKK